MSRSDLLQHLQGYRTVPSCNTPDVRDGNLQDIMAQLACGLDALSATYNIVHRDLAGRNCLVQYGAATARPRVMICDFDAARTVATGGVFHDPAPEAYAPLRWLAPETALTGIYSRASDVYTLGVVFWEVSTLGSIPFAGLTDAEVYDQLAARVSPALPPSCPDHLSSLIRSMWECPSHRRPVAAIVHARLRDTMQAMDATPQIPMADSRESPPATMLTAHQSHI